MVIAKQLDTIMGYMIRYSIHFSSLEENQDGMKVSSNASQVNDHSLA